MCDLEKDNAAAENETFVQDIIEVHSVVMFACEAEQFICWIVLIRELSFASSCKISPTIDVQILCGFRI